MAHLADRGLHQLRIGKTQRRTIERGRALNVLAPVLIDEKDAPALFDHHRTGGARQAQVCETDQGCVVRGIAAVRDDHGKPCLGERLNKLATERPVFAPILGRTDQKGKGCQALHPGKPPLSKLGQAARTRGRRSTGWKSLLCGMFANGSVRSHSPCAPCANCGHCGSRSTPRRFPPAIPNPI